MSERASLADLSRRMAAVVGARNCFSSGPDLLTYECDGITHGRTRPDLVVLPGTTQEVVEVSPAAPVRSPARWWWRSRACAASSR
jgi:hypothetical protein